MKNTMTLVVDLGSTLLITGIAVIMFVLYLGDRTGEPRPEVDGWQDWPSDAVRLGAADGRLTISYFGDFTCGYCARLAPVLDSLMADYPDQVSVDFLHFPLSDTGAPMERAKAAECADAQGLFEPMYDFLYRNIETMDELAWNAIADSADISDVPKFLNCMANPPEDFERIDRGRTVGRSAGVRGTPSVFLSGKEFSGRTLSEFKGEVERLGLPQRD